ncbi:alphaalpha-trehalose-phosphate synthase, partial [Trifolium medium]|nr:alphaalpha-trehalose-phosphate synthase [Trifolium medium]
GFNGTLTEPVEKTGDQIKEMELKVHPELRQPLTALCSDPNTTVVVLSGSGRKVLDDNFKEYDMWLAAENGMFLQPSKGEWMTTMPEHLNMEWVDSVKKEHRGHILISRRGKLHLFGITNMQVLA